MEGGQSSVGERLIHRGRKFDFAVATVRTRSGAVVERELVRHPGAVVIAATLDDGRLLFVRQTRVSVGRPMLELPAGTMDRDEPPEACAARELEEETGYRAATVEPVGRFYPSPGMSDELMRVFTARSLTHVGQSLEDDESIEVVALTPNELAQWLTDGRDLDGKSIAALAMAGCLPPGAGP